MFYSSAPLSPRKYEGIALVLALITTQAVSGQIRIPSGAASGQTLPSLVADVIVTTNIKTATGTHTQVESGKFSRASDGRTRQDTAMGSLINSRTEGMLIHLSHGDRIATVTARQARETSQAPFATTTPPATAIPARSRDPRIEDLGEKMIGGFMARGRRITVPNPAEMRLGLMITEMWESKEIGLILYSKQTSPSGATEQRYENVQLVEPAPGVFDIPAGYTIQERLPQGTPTR